MTSNSTFWLGKRVLVTGHTGFKGGWLSLWLQQLGAEVVGVALAPNTVPNLFELANIKNGMTSHFCDIRDVDKIKQIINEANPEIVFHLAAQPLVRESYSNPLATYATNVMGTANVLDTLRGLVDIRVAVMITTDKVYQNKEWYFPYRETDSLGGHDPYSASKAASEIVISSYRDAYLKAKGVAIASARAGNVIGGGDWSIDRLIPDALRAWQSATSLEVRQPNSIRPWQHVLEPLHGYLELAKKIWHQPELAGAFNFGPRTHEAATVREVIELARSAYGCGDVIYMETNAGLHEASWLALETAKAHETLSVKSIWNLEESVNRTIKWYHAQQQGSDVRSLCLTEILEYGTPP